MTDGMASYRNRLPRPNMLSTATSAFARRGVGQQAPAGDVSAGPDAGHVRAALVGCLNSLAVEIDAGLLQSEVRQDRDPAGRSSERSRRRRCPLLRMHPRTPRSCRLCDVTLQDDFELDPCLGHLLLQPGGNLAVASGGDLRQHFQRP